uniref:Uncharacterized protein n=1 Tax=Kalanchoe fedtschenkoi TaxID=63787 RepID=A0A7N0U3T1_KALFE
MIGLVVHSDDAAYVLYNYYVRRVGFNVRKGNRDIVLRSINDKQIELLRSFRKCGIKLSDTLRFLKFQYCGSPNIDFINIDAYNALAKPDCKSFNGSDANSLIEIFKERQQTE